MTNTGLYHAGGTSDNYVRQAFLLSLNQQEDEDYYDDSDFGYTDDELEQMYRDAFENDPEAEWNID